MLHYAKPTPSQEFLQETYEYDITDKTFPLKRRFDAPRGSTKAGDRPGDWKKNYNYTYITLRVRNKKYFGDNSQHQFIMSRIVWKYHKGVEPKGVIDHINGDSTDNRIENLQDITQKQNVNEQAGEIIK